jgi:hypothetical protein
LIAADFPIRIMEVAGKISVVPMILFFVIFILVPCGCMRLKNLHKEIIASLLGFYISNNATEILALFYSETEIKFIANPASALLLSFFGKAFD